MPENSQIKNPKTSESSKKNESANREFEFCKVCKRNHDEGKRHRYFPSHVKSLSSFLSRFKSKLSDVRFFLLNPTPLLPELSSHNRLWCVFCDVEILELGSSFACSNAIIHLASSEHFRCLKAFSWKYGCAMDRLDSFKVSELELAKWQKKCVSLKRGDVAASDKSRVIYGPLNDIHENMNHENVTSFEPNIMYSYDDSNFPNHVTPLHRYTNENYQVPRSEISQNVHPCSHVGAPSGEGLWSLKQIPEGNTRSTGCHHHVLSNGGYPADAWVSEVVALPVSRRLQQAGKVNGDNSFRGLQTTSQNLSMAPDIIGGNVHSGAPPPWLEGPEGHETQIQVERGLEETIHVSALGRSRKSSKLNPKRVGAAWAEKRKRELEMEKRGDITTSSYDDNWLPEFGRVWQTGSRKESRREFEKEKQKGSKIETQSQLSLKVQPYVSKRMRPESTQ